MIQLIDDQRDAWAVAEDVAGFIGTSQAMLWRELVIEDIEDGSKARSRRFEVLWWFHFTDTTRIMLWVVSFFISRPFRAGASSSRAKASCSGPRRIPKSSPS